jgi:ribosomal-protein-alanine acetyltransferase
MCAAPMLGETFNESFKIEKTSAENIPALVQIEIENNLSSWGEKGFENEIKNSNSVLLVCLEKKSKKTLGFILARLITPEFEILNIAVLNEHKRQGIGGALLQSVIDIAVKNECSDCWLEMRETNFRARGFYQKFGFIEAGKRKNYYTNPREDAILFKLNLKNLPCENSFN